MPSTTPPPASRVPPPAPPMAPSPAPPPPALPPPTEPTRSVMKRTVPEPQVMSGSAGTEPNDDTFSVPVEWPRGSKPVQPDSAFSTAEKGGMVGSGSGGGGGGSSAVGSGGGAVPADDDDNSSDEEGLEDDGQSPGAPSSSPGTVKWKLALLFLSSVYEIVSIVTKTRLFLAINEIESCFRCGYSDEFEDLATALFIPSLMFLVFLILKEGGKVTAAFLNICCECDLFCGDETVWPRNVFTPLMYLIKPTVIVPSYQKDYEYEYSQSHTLLNLCTEDLPFLIFGIYAPRLEIKAGFGVFISAVGVVWDVFEAVRYLRKK